MGALLDEKEQRVEIITNALLHLPIRGKELELAARQIELALAQAGHLSTVALPDELECDPDGCKAHIDAFMERAEAAEARIKALEEALNETLPSFKDSIQLLNMYGASTVEHTNAYHSARSALKENAL